MEDRKGLWSTAWGVATAVFAGLGGLVWQSAATAGSTTPLWPAYVFGIATLVGLYCVFAPVMHSWPFQDDRPREWPIPDETKPVPIPEQGNEVGPGQPNEPGDAEAPPGKSARVAPLGSVSYSQRTLYGSLANSLQAALAEGMSIRDRLPSLASVALNVLRYQAPATEKDIDDWIKDVRSRLRQEPIHLAMFDQATPSSPELKIRQIAMLKHERYEEINYKLQQLEKIIRRLNDDEGVS